MRRNIVLVCPDGHSVLLFCKEIVRVLQSEKFSNVIVVTDPGKYGEEIKALGVTLVDVPYPRWMNPLADFKYCFSLYQVFKREKCSGVLNFSTKSNIYGAIAGHLAGVKLIVCHVVGLGAAFAKKPGFMPRVIEKVFLSLYRLACMWSSKVWFTNANDRKTFLELGLINNERCLLTRNYLDTSDYVLESVTPKAMESARLAIGAEANTKIVVMVARMIWQKGIAEFAGAAEILALSRSNVLFVLIAPLETGSPDAVPESFIREKEQKANLRWLGFQDDVRPFYAISDLAVLPTYYKEGGYPRALLEPMSMGKPIIASTSDDCRGTVEEGKNGFLVPPRDPGALADAILRLLDHVAMRHSFGVYSRQKALRDFDEKVIVPQAMRGLGFVVNSDENY